MEFSYLINKGKEFISNQRNIIIVNPTIIMLPTKKLIGTTITMYNETNSRVSIDSNSETDLIYSHLYAPNGKHQVIIEPNRKIVLTYIINQNKLGKWYLDIY